MNIFVLDIDPAVAARYHCDKHVISQMKESVQMLCTALLHYDNDVPLNSSGSPYKSAYPSHPCTKWVIDGLLNYQWLWDLTYALCEEAEYRFGGTYHISTIMRDGTLPRTPQHFASPPTRTPFANATADWLKSSAEWDVPAAYVSMTAVDIYRMYYIVDKCLMTSVDAGSDNTHWLSKHTLGATFDDFSIWTKRGAPDFMGDRFYRQQCEYFGIKPSQLMTMHRHPDLDESVKLRAKIERKMGVKATGSVTAAKSKRVTKADVLVDIRDITGATGFDGLLKLTLPQMQAFKLACTNVDPDSLPALPTGRAKAPYVAECIEFFGNSVDFSKLTIPVIKEILQHFGAE